MKNSTILKLTENYYPDKEENVYNDLFKQYNRVVIESLLTTFGLDALLIKDQYGGDVDTIHNVRKIGTDNQMTYKNHKNEENYKNLEKYDSKYYHQDSNFRNIKRETKEKFREDYSPIKDQYTEKDIGFYGHSKGISSDRKAELDHILGASEVHQDRGRVLSKTNGKDLANSDWNFAWTNKSLNASMGAWANQVNEEYKRKYGCDAPAEKIDMKAYIEAHPDLDENTKKNMMEYYNKAKSEYEKKINRDYYFSSDFRNDLFNSSAKLGMKMGIRQAVGFFLSEIIFTVMEEFKKFKTDKLGDLFKAISSGIKKGYENAKLKYKKLLEKFKEGFLAGILSSITTTLINIFFTTSKNIIRVIRQVWASLIEALKIIFFNPDNLPFGERMRAVAKVLSVSASVIVGIIVREALSKIGLSSIPIIGDDIVTFLELLSMGFTSCTLLYFLDNNKTVNKIVDFLNNLPTISKAANYYKEQAKYFEIYAAQILSIDIKTFENEINNFNFISHRLGDAKTEEELNIILIDFFKKMNIKLPWEGDFDEFMSNKNSTLIFD